MQTSLSGNKSQAEIIRWLDHIKTDYWYLSQMAISRRALARYCGIDAALDLSPVNLTKLSQAINDVNARRVVFLPPKEGDFWILDPPRELRKIRKLSRNWGLFSRCDSCLDNKFLPIFLNEREEVACYHCFPPEQYACIGAKKRDVSLIAEVARKLLG